LEKLGAIFTGIFLLTVFGCNAAEPPKFGVVDVAKVVQNAKTSQKANAEIEALVKTKQAELNQKAEALKKLEKSLKEPGSKMKPDELNKAAAEYQKLGADAEADVKKKAGELRKTVLDQIKKVIENIGKDEKFVMIFIADNVPYYQATTDVTEKVIQKYDESAGVNTQTAPPASKTESPQTAPPPSK
jgi:Skp family chaperone for outer membrane proteins